MPAEHSAILIDGVQRGSLQKCPHCGGHFIVAAHGSIADAKQSAISDISFPRVFCQKCGRLTCGRPGCNPALACTPIEARLEYVEGKRGTPYDEVIEKLIIEGHM